MFIYINIDRHIYLSRDIETDLVSISMFIYSTGGAPSRDCICAAAVKKDEGTKEGT